MADRLLTFWRDDRPAAQRGPTLAEFRELDRVRVTEEIEGEDGERVPAGSEGTVVAIWGDGAAFEVEFMRPVETLAAIRPDVLRLVERAAD
ncbi:DUF4926 domain-containing protein [Methylobacterium sp. DB1607]|nr:DUF4926 domain-containing protein [Methylobacterium sp. DB1607]